MKIHQINTFFIIKVFIDCIFSIFIDKKNANFIKALVVVKNSKIVIN